MNRFAAFAAASALALAPSVAIAQASDFYAATPKAAPAKTSFVTRSTIWKCANGTCTAAKASSREAIMCELVAREVGELSEFRANGTAFDADALAKCNTKAR